MERGRKGGKKEGWEDGEGGRYGRGKEIKHYSSERKIIKTDIKYTEDI